MARIGMPDTPAWLENWAALNGYIIGTNSYVLVWELYRVGFAGSEPTEDGWRPMLQCRPVWTLEEFLKRCERWVPP